MNTSEADVPVSLARKILIVAAGVLLVDSFLPWYHVSFGGLGGVSANGWHDVGVIAWLLTIVLLAAEAARLFGVLPLDEARSELLSLALAAGVLLFGLIYVIVRLTDGYLGFGFYIGLVALIALGVGAFWMFRSGDAAETLRALKEQRATPPNDPGTPPTA